MGYRMVYGVDPFEDTGKQKSHLKAMTAGFLLAFVLLVRLLWPQGTALLRQTLLPRENPAFAQLQSDLQAGEPIGDAVTAFCQRIVEEALAEAS